MAAGTKRTADASRRARRLAVRTRTPSLALYPHPRRRTPRLGEHEAKQEEHEAKQRSEEEHHRRSTSPTSVCSIDGSHPSLYEEEENPNEALLERTFIFPNLAEQFFGRSLVIGSHCLCVNLVLLSLSSSLEELGDGFNAPNLKRLDGYTKRITYNPATSWNFPFKGGALKRFGNGIEVINLAELDLSNQRSFQEFGSRFSAPNLVQLELRNADTIERFPEDFELVSLTSLNLIGAKSFQHFPDGFFDNMPRIRSIEIEETKVTYRSLPRHIRQNRDIHIDIRPPDEQQQALNGAQNTHHTSVNFSSSQSARNIRDRANLTPTKFEAERNDLEGFVLRCPGYPEPEGLQDRLSLGLEEFYAQVKELPEHHPHRLFYSSPINCAQRSVRNQMSDFVHPTLIDHASGVGLLEYIVCCWCLKRIDSEREEGVEEETASQAFILILYYIQRGYNFQGNPPIDDGDARDRPVCGSGAFNTVTNAMTGILRKANVILITEDSIKMKIDAEIRHAIRTRLQEARNLPNGREKILKIFFEDHSSTISSFGKNLIREDIEERVRKDFLIEGEPREEEDRKKRKIDGFLDYQIGEIDKSDFLTMDTQ